MYRCSINVYRCAELHKFQAILKDDTKPASACPCTLLVAKTAGRKNLTRELLNRRIWVMPEVRERRERERSSQEKKNERRKETVVTVPIMRNEGWFVQQSDIEIRWNPIFIITRAAAYHSADSYCHPDKVGPVFTIAKLPGFFVSGMSSDFHADNLYVE